ncbi:MAG: diaminopimelate epimerase [Flavobacteriaceae bacterium]|nr:diaminopimelate epimerase [Flavobacteriaceae bacterium]
MKLKFYKYQGTGNDFVILDNRNGEVGKLTAAQIKKICDRRFGVGADGMMLLEDARGADFKMVYYNADGKLSSMCGNGGRCIVKFANEMKVVDGLCNFVATDGSHRAKLRNGNVQLGMNNVSNILIEEDVFILNTGSPHYVLFVDAIQSEDVKTEGRNIRNNDTYKTEGINVNFVGQTSNGIYVRTYERGVEDETLSCGTGVTAAAIAHHAKNIKSNGNFVILVDTLGGSLKVHFTCKEGQYSTIVLEGPAEFIFEGEIEI